MRAHIRRFSLVGAAIVLLVVLFVQTVFAHDGKGESLLDQQLQELTEKVAALESTIQSIFAGPGVVVNRDGFCRLGGSDYVMQDASVLKYKEKFDEWPDVDGFDMYGVQHHPDNGKIIVAHRDTGMSFAWSVIVFESWQNCEYVDSFSVALDIRGNPDPRWESSNEQ